MKELSEKEVDMIVSRALKERMSERFMFKLADNILKDSEMTDEMALRCGHDTKRPSKTLSGLTELFSSDLKSDEGPTVLIRKTQDRIMAHEKVCS